jgi:membrane-bound lytic murein transglycosylase D
MIARAEPKSRPTASMADALARAETKAKPKAQAKPKARPPTQVSRAGPQPKAKPAAGPKVARAEPPAKTAKAKSGKAASHHVVQPNETLYRVAVRYELSVEELKRLNRIKPDDNTIRPGQKLRVRS